MPISNHKTIQLAHGAGGLLSMNLINEVFLPYFSNESLNRLDDFALLYSDNKKLAFTTDSYVVDPIFFPGGDIGELAIYGTVNDLSMSGGVPLWISVSFIIEEGFPIDDLKIIAQSMKRASDRSNVRIVTGDTKVVPRGACDKIFINTSGIAKVSQKYSISGYNIKAGDQIILSGTIADHGMAVMTSRNNLSFESEICSDLSPLNDLVQCILNICPEVHAFRDPTRGGIGVTLNEFARQSQVGIVIRDNKIPIHENVRGACEVLGIDPYFVANEGKLIAVVPNMYSEKVLDAMRDHPLGKDSAIIGEVVSNHPSTVVITTLLGVKQILDIPAGDQLPRIC